MAVFNHHLLWAKVLNRPVFLGSHSEAALGPGCGRARVAGTHPSATKSLVEIQFIGLWIAHQISPQKCKGGTVSSSTVINIPERHALHCAPAQKHAKPHTAPGVFTTEGSAELCAHQALPSDFVGCAGLKPTED